ncbi:GNAT family N-acetyltransferase [Occallatibacter savannae]|uniref:GNAT family N-acetyltransferase n=1 Tax=Occallatibacter savannae TaxID=1002691 RepID=UPI000D690C08|nr:GNAT family N-acetyltransferase [Occallatibacter savannae]
MHSHEIAKEGRAENADGGEEALLDNPIWNALRTEHSEYAQVEGEARRYEPAIGPLAGAPDQSAESYDALRPLAGPGGVLALFFPDQPAPGSGWSLFRGGVLTQMIWRGREPIEVEALNRDVVMRRLGAEDVAAMVELATLTEPGPFRDGTIELGNFYGVLEGERLLAMAGQRMRVPGFVEVSAVCTHPDARGRGYAGALMSRVMRDIVAEGATPFLHAFADNPAVSLYRKLGFVERRRFELAVIKRED